MGPRGLIPAFLILAPVPFLPEWSVVTFAGESTVGALTGAGTAVYLRHWPLQCMEMRRERRKGIVQRPLTPAHGLSCDLLGGVGSREDEALSGGKSPSRFCGPVRWVTPSPEPGVSAGIPHPSPRTPPAGPRTLQAGGGAARGGRCKELQPRPGTGCAPTHLREGAPPGGGGAGVRGGLDSQPALSSQEAAHYLASLKSN